MKPVQFELNSYEDKNGWRTNREIFEHLRRKKYPYVKFKTMEMEVTGWLYYQLRHDHLVVQMNGGTERYLFFTSESDMASFLLTWKKNDNGNF